MRKAVEAAKSETRYRVTIEFGVDPAGSALFKANKRGTRLLDGPISLELSLLEQPLSDCLGGIGSVLGQFSMNISPTDRNPFAIAMFWEFDRIGHQLVLGPGADGDEMVPDTWVSESEFQGQKANVWLPKGKQKKEGACSPPQPGLTI